MSCVTRLFGAVRTTARDARSACLKITSFLSEPQISTYTPTSGDRDGSLDRTYFSQSLWLCLCLRGVRASAAHICFWERRFAKEICLTIYKGRRASTTAGCSCRTHGDGHHGRRTNDDFSLSLSLILSISSSLFPFPEQPLRMQEVRQVGSLASR